MGTRVALGLFLAGFAALGSTAVTQQPASGEWAGWRGPNLNLTVTDPDGVQQGRHYRFEVIWKKKLGSGYSPVSVSRGIAVTGFSDEQGNYVGAFDADKGEPIWRFKTGPMFAGRFGSANGPIAAPLIAGRRVFAVDNLGVLFALELRTGRELWRVNFVDELGAEMPFYGYASAPMLYEDSVIVQTGGKNGAITRFVAETGDVRWSAGIDTTQYQSPTILEIGGKQQIVLIGDEKLAGIDLESGSVLWEGPHGGRGIPTGTATTNPVPVAADTLLVKAVDQSTLFKIHPEATAPLEKLWQSRDLKNSYVVSVHFDGLLFGNNNRVLNCVDAATGERLWRSREPGDGFPIVVNGHLIIITKEGTLSMAPASREGYNEVASARIFDDLVWTPASYVDGRLYVRSLTEWARVDIIPSETPMRVVDAKEGILPDSEFERRAETVRRAPRDERQRLIDDWMSQQTLFPVVEGAGRVHFVYRGEAQEVALVSDLFGGRTDRKMNHIEGTDLFYFSAELESDARIGYGFIRDFGQFEPDPLNPHRPRVDDSQSQLAMPDWDEPAHLAEAPRGQRGTIESLTLESELRQRSIELQVYLPSSFSPDRRYPVLFLLDKQPDFAREHLKPSFDNLMGETVEPAIAVFVPFFGRFPYLEYVGEDLPSYVDVLLNEILPLVEQTYPTEQRPTGRALIGTMNSTYTSVYTAFRHPGIFGKLGLQSMRWEPGFRSGNRKMLQEAERQDLTIYLDWGKYDGRSEKEGFDVRGFSMAFAEDLEAAGYTFTGGEVHDGPGPDSWIQRTDRLLETLFPLRR